MLHYTVGIKTPYKYCLITELLLTFKKSQSLKAMAMSEF